MSGETGAIRVRAALEADLPAIEQLVTRRSLPTDGVREHLSGFLVAEEGPEVVGCAGVERHGALGLLRSVAVRDSAAGRGIGRQLVDAAIARAVGDRLRTLYLLTTTAEDYFPRFGFRTISRAELPAALSASAELQGACPASATAMRLSIEGTA